MPVVKTDLRVTRERAAQVRFYPTPSNVATNVQDAIGLAGGGGSGTSPPAITPTAVNFAMSPYTVLPTDYLLLVDSSGGAVSIVLGLASARGKKDVVIKDDGGVAAANNITVNRTAPDTVDGATSYPIDTNRQVYRFTPKAGGNYTVTT